MEAMCSLVLSSGERIEVGFEEERVNALMIRESQLMRIHYATGVAALFVVAVSYSNAPINAI